MISDITEYRGKAIEFHRITKIYPDGVIALRNINLDIYEGSIHGLLGENGAGKTTLMRILYGEIRPTKGYIKIFGEKVAFKGPWDAIKKGIGMVYQHFTLIPTFTILENIYLFLTSLGYKENIYGAEEDAEDLINKMGIDIPLGNYAEDLPIGVQQKAEILKILLAGARILILDEPTSVLTPIEIIELFKMLRILSKRGITIIYITHKLKEVLDITDRITILREGRIVNTINTLEADEVKLAEMMFGKRLQLYLKKKPITRGKKILEVRNLRVFDERGLERVKNISLDIHSGEILGIAGIQGNGQKELVEAILGMSGYEGEILFEGININKLPPNHRYRLGISYVPDSRIIGLIYDMSITKNVSLTNLDIISYKYGIIDWDKAARLAREIADRFKVVMPSIETYIKYLSGGNQQKIMVGREMLKGSKLFIFEEPTHGLDMEATNFIRKTILRLREEGKAIILISTDLEEIMTLSDRIAVIFRGKVVSIDEAEKYTMQKLGLQMGGVSR